MAVRWTPGEGRAEAHRQRIKSLGRAATTEELKEAADAVSAEATKELKKSEKFLGQVKNEMENSGSNGTEGE